jgi:hypothetical protein
MPAQIIYLYMKTHNQTGLKYLGKTAQADPYKYRGSGTYWASHIKKHGYNVTTEILKVCGCSTAIKIWGCYYSRLWNVVKSNEWANLKEEAGDGGAVPLELRPHLKTKEYRDKLSTRTKERWSIPGAVDQMSKKIKSSFKADTRREINRHSATLQWMESREKKMKGINRYYNTASKEDLKKRHNAISEAHKQRALSCDYINPRSVQVVTPKGKFNSITAARRAYRLSAHKFDNLLREHPDLYFKVQSVETSSEA